MEYVLRKRQLVLYAKNELWFGIFHDVKNKTRKRASQMKPKVCIAFCRNVESSEMFRKNMTRSELCFRKTRERRGIRKLFRNQMQQFG